MIAHDQKKKIIQKFASHNKDTGSAEVQIAILTERINALTEHLKEHAKDVHSRRGLVKLVGRRSKLLKGLRESDTEVYEKITKDLKLRQQKAASKRTRAKTSTKKSKAKTKAKTTKATKATKTTKTAAKKTAKKTTKAKAPAKAAA